VRVNKKLFEQLENLSDTVPDGTSYRDKDGTLGALYFPRYLSKKIGQQILDLKSIIFNRIIFIDIRI
jgi:hypothetical protein